MSMRFEDLRVFTVVAQQGSLHGAAQAMGLTQSAVTKAVQRLEAAFGLRILNRSRRGIALTPAGEVLLERSQRLELGVADLQAEMASMRSAESGVVRLGTIPALLEPTLIPLLARLRRRRPQVQCHVELQTSARLTASVQAGRLDFALAVVSGRVPDELQAEPLDQLRYHIVGRLGHPLAQQPPNLAALAQADWLLPPQGIGMRTAIDQFFVDAGLPPPRAAVQADTSSAWFAELLRQTDMVAAFTDLMMSSRLGLGLQVLPFSEIPLTNDLRLLFRRAAYLSPLLDEVRAELKASFNAA